MSGYHWRPRHQPLLESSSASSALSAEMLHSDHSAASDHTTITTCSSGRSPVGRCESVYLLPTRLATVLLALVQGLVLDCYLTHYNSVYWYTWIAGDVAVLLMFVVAFVISYRQMMLVMRDLTGSGAASSVVTSGSRGGSCCPGNVSVIGVEPGIGKDCEEEEEEEEEDLVTSPGSMPLVYFAWLVYSSVLAIRVLLIYKNLAHQLKDDVFLGSNTLQMTVAMSSMVFLLLLLAHHDAAPHCRRRQRIDNLTYFVLFDIVDAADLLGVLSRPSAHDSMDDWVTWCVLGVACVNFILPTLPLMALSRTQFGARRLPETLQTLLRLMVLFAVNVPLLATRLMLWNYLHLPVSTFLVKNIAVSFLILYSFYERDHHRRVAQRLMEAQETIS